MRTLGTIALAFGVGCGVLEAAPTAKQAIEAMASQRGLHYKKNLVRVVGIRGIDQPPVWRIITRDPARPGVVRDFAVQGGRVVGDQFVPPAYQAKMPSIVFPAGSLGVDSSNAFLVADRAANNARVGFDTLDYELVAADPASGPVWIVRLNDTKGLRVGEVVVRARDGHLVRQQWFPSSGGGFAANRQGYPRSATGSTNQGWEKTKQGFGRGGDAVKSGLMKAGGSMKGFWDSMVKKGKEFSQRRNQPQPRYAPYGQGQPSYGGSGYPAPQQGQAPYSGGGQGSQYRPQGSNSYGAGGGGYRYY